MEARRVLIPQRLAAAEAVSLESPRPWVGAVGLPEGGAAVWRTRKYGPVYPAAHQSAALSQAWSGESPGLRERWRWNRKGFFPEPPPSRPADPLRQKPGKDPPVATPADPSEGSDPQGLVETNRTSDHASMRGPCRASARLPAGGARIGSRRTSVRAGKAAAIPPPNLSPVAASGARLCPPSSFRQIVEFRPREQLEVVGHRLSNPAVHVAPNGSPRAWLGRPVSREKPHSVQISAASPVAAAHQISRAPMRSGGDKVVSGWKGNRMTG